MEGKAERKFKDLGKKIDSMLEDLSDLKENLKSKYGDRWDEINRSKEKLEGDLKNFREQHKDRFEEAENSIEKAGEEIRKAFETIFKTKPSDKSTEPPPQEKASEH